MHVHITQLDVSADSRDVINGVKYTTLRGTVSFTIKVALSWGYEERARDSPLEIPDLM